MTLLLNTFKTNPEVGPTSDAKSVGRIGGCMIDEIGNMLNTLSRWLSCTRGIS